MSERSNLRKWRSLNNDRARSSDEDSFRGQKVKSGLFFKLTIGLGFIAIICTLAIPNPKDQIKNAMMWNKLPGQFMRRPGGIFVWGDT